MKISYSPLSDCVVDSATYRHTPEAQAEEKNDPLFFKLTFSPYDNWIISIDNLKLSDESYVDEESGEKFCDCNFTYVVEFVPHGVPDSDIRNAKQELDHIVREVFTDMITKATEYAQEILAPNENEQQQTTESPA